MSMLAELILERDKERGGGIVVTMPTTSDAVAVQNRPAPLGKPGFMSDARRDDEDVAVTTSRRSNAADGINPGFSEGAG